MAFLLNSSVLCGCFMKNSIARSMHRKPTHYEVLKLNQNCSAAEIKRAYYELSKKYHPDRNPKNGPKLFLDVSEAYKTLGKPESRLTYDLSLHSPGSKLGIDHYKQYARRNRTNDPVFHRRKSPSYQYDSVQPRAASANREKLTKCLALVAVLIFFSLGVSLQVMSIKRAMRIRREELRLRGTLAARRIEKARPVEQNEDKAEKTHHNQAQIKLLEERFKENNISLE